MRQNDEPLEELDCFKHLGRKWHRTKDVVHRMNGCIKPWEHLKV